jgi:predicted HAD superfamily phosphohydrolase YqeG
MARLYTDYKKHGKLIIAFDFDNTVFDFHNVGDTFPEVISILQDARKAGHTLVLFTANEGYRLQKIREHLSTIGLNPYYVNESPVFKDNRKPYYNILLDDRAGLESAFNQLNEFLIFTNE